MAVKRSNTSNGLQAPAGASDAFTALLAEAEIAATGPELVDKVQFLGVPFIVTGVMLRTTNSGVETMLVEVMLADGSKYSFTDASTGVKAELGAFLAKKGLTASADSWTDVRAFAPAGLRVSEYEVPEGPRKGQKARTYYLTGGTSR